MFKVKYTRIVDTRVCVVSTAFVFFFVLSSVLYTSTVRANAAYEFRFRFDELNSGTLNAQYCRDESFDFVRGVVHRIDDGLVDVSGCIHRQYADKRYGKFDGRSAGFSAVSTIE